MGGDLGAVSGANVNITTILLIVIVVFSLLGFILGIKRGLRRSVFRFILTLAVILFSYFANKNIVAWLFNLNVNGATLLETISTMLPAEMASLAGIIMILIEVIAGLIVFILSVLLLHFASWLVYGILKFIIPRGEKKKRFAGGIVGLLGGAILSFSLILPINAFAVDVVKFSSIQINGTSIVDVQTIGLNDYVESDFSKTLNVIGAPIYHELTKSKNANGEDVSLSGIIDSVNSSMKIVEEIGNLANVDFSGGLNDDNIASLKDAFIAIDEHKNEIDPVILDAMIGVVGEVIPDANINTDGIDLKDVNFTQEAELIESLHQISQGTSEASVTDTINALADSTLILPVAENSKIVVNLEGEEKAEALEAINALTDENKKTTLLKLFGEIAYEENTETGTGGEGAGEGGGEGEGAGEPAVE